MMKSNNKLEEFRSRINNNIDEVITELNTFFKDNNTKDFSVKYNFSWGSVSSLLQEKGYRLQKGQLIKFTEDLEKEEKTNKTKLTEEQLLLLLKFSNSLEKENILNKKYIYGKDSNLSIRLDSSLKEELEKVYNKFSYLKKTDILNECIYRGIESLLYLS